MAQRRRQAENALLTASRNYANLIIGQSLNAQFERFEQRLQAGLDRRFGRLERSVDGLNQRVDGLNQRFDNLVNALSATPILSPDLSSSLRSRPSDSPNSSRVSTTTSATAPSNITTSAPSSSIPHLVERRGRPNTGQRVRAPPPIGILPGRTVSHFGRAGECLPAAIAQGLLILDGNRIESNGVRDRVIQYYRNHVSQFEGVYNEDDVEELINGQNTPFMLQIAAQVFNHRFVCHVSIDNNAQGPYTFAGPEPPIEILFHRDTYWLVDPQ